MERILYFDCFSGISGDMVLAALLHLGLPEERLRRELGGLDLPNYTLEISRRSRQGISALDLQVLPGPDREPHRRLSDVRRIVEKSPLAPPVKVLSLAIFRRLAEAEARVHGQAVEEVHFHEVGAVDAVVDIVGAAIGLEHLKPGRILSSELPVGRGFVRCAHGVMPLPAPATLEILKGYPLRQTELEAELVTPTGAAILAEVTSGFSPFPSMAVKAIGYGMGKKEFPDRPNLLRLVLGEAPFSGETDRAIVLETNIDDMNPEFYDHLMERLFEGGALDVSLSPLLMKKNRPGTLLRVIAREEDSGGLTALILEETTTLGVRTYAVERRKLHREVGLVQTRYGPVRVKVAGGRFQPEYEDCRKIAREKGIPLPEVYQEAVRSFEETKQSAGE